MIYLSISITEGVRISVKADYLRDNADPLQPRHIFAYHITIENHGFTPVRLLRRHWIIQDALLRMETVEGEGVVGQKPHLRPGGSFDYTSYCPLSTEWGTMRGHYTMERPDGSTFEAAIPAFALLVPGLLN